MLGEGVDLFYVPLPLSLAGKTLADAGIGARTGLNVIGVQKDGRIITNLPPALKLARDSTLIAIGSAEQMERFGAVHD
jgi:K+/H+ antiporter YhaU regulatory subunit KhtT